MTAYILSASVAIGSPQGEILPDRDAPRYAAKAIYKHLGLDDDVSEWEKKYIKLDKYPQLKYIGIIGRVVSEKQISWQWRF